MNRKVALINPGKDQKYAVLEPLHLGFIASYLEKNGIEVRIIDELAGENVEDEINKYRPDIVGITATTPLAPDAYRIADMCRRMGMLTVMGGIHASVLPEEALQHVDIVVKGEGEVAMLDIVRNGIRSGIVSCPYIKNLDEVPLPARHLMKMDFYLCSRDRMESFLTPFVPPHTKSASILTSRGCPYACIFCHNTWRDAPYRFNSAERVISEIEQLIEVYGIEALFFIEDNLFVNKPRLREIAELMKKNRLNIIWGGNARVDNVDLETLQLAKEAGCRQVTFGFESGSQRILDVLNKGITVEQSRKAIKLCRKAGLIVNGTFMIGNPTETTEDIRATQDFIRDHDIAKVGILITTPYPGTELWKWCESHNLIPQSFNWADFAYTKVAIPACDTMPPEEIDRQFHETRRIGRQTVKFSQFILMNLAHPVETIVKIGKAIRHPAKIREFRRRLRI
jgi:magnesium-protoporphyrin IX monomethyl ester (oxidative) cyclase